MSSSAQKYFISDLISIFLGIYFANFLRSKKNQITKKAANGVGTVCKTELSIQELFYISERLATNEATAQLLLNAIAIE